MSETEQHCSCSCHAARQAFMSRPLHFAAAWMRAVQKAALPAAIFLSCSLPT